MNPLYSMLMGGGNAPRQAPQQMQMPMNPIQKTNAIMQAMRNPSAFVRQMIPDLPPEIANDSAQVLRYLQRTRGISDEQIRQIASSIPHF